MKTSINWWRVGLIALIVACVSFEIQYDIRYFRPLEMPDSFVLIYILTFVCRMMLYIFLIRVYNKACAYSLKVKARRIKTIEEWRIGLVRLYQHQYEDSTSAFMRQVLMQARRHLNSGAHPQKVENWVVTMEKNWRKKL